jgi:hypothetical protein
MTEIEKERAEYVTLLETILVDFIRAVDHASHDELHEAAREAREALGIVEVPIP